MQEDGVGLLLELPGLGHGVVEGGAHHHDLQPLAPVVPHAVDLELGRGGRHEDGAAHPQPLAAVGDALRVVARARSHHTPPLLLLAQVPKSSGRPPDLEAADRLQVLPLEVDVGPVLGGEVGRPLQRRVLDDLLVLAVGLVDAGRRDHLALSVGRNHLALPVGLRVPPVVGTHMIRLVNILDWPLA